MDAARHHTRRSGHAGHKEPRCVGGRFLIDNFGGLVDARPGGFRPDLEHEDTALVNGKLEIDASQRGGSGVSGGDGDCLSRQLPRLGRGQGEALRIRLRSATAHGALPRRIVGLGDRLAAKTSLHNRQADRVHQNDIWGVSASDETIAESIDGVD